MSVWMRFQYLSWRLRIYTTEQAGQGFCYRAEQGSSEKYKQQTTIIWRLGSLLTEIRQDDAAVQNTMMEVSSVLRNGNNNFGSNPVYSMECSLDHQIMFYTNKL